MKPYNLINNDEKEEIIRQYYNNFSSEEIINNLQISKRALWRILKESGINTKLKNRYTVNHEYFNSINSEHKAYWLGLLFADGFVGNEKYNNVVISLKEQDQALLEEFRKDIEFSGNLRLNLNAPSSFSKNSYNYILNFSSKEMATQLRQLGLSAGKAKEVEKLPRIDIDLIPHFIRGYFDGDGCIGYSNNRRYYTNASGEKIKYTYRKPFWNIMGNEQFLKEIMKYIDLPYKIHDSRTDYMKYAQLYGGKTSFQTLFNYLYKDATIYMERKYQKWQEIIGAIGE